MTLVGCGGSGSASATIDRTVFVETYVDLRVAALDADSQRVAGAERDEILARHGVTAAELSHFADVHSGDLEYMREVWNDVEFRLDRTPVEN